MGKNSKAPPAPDPVATANAQGAANRDTAIAERTMNNVDQYTPYGSVTYQQTGMANGAPTYAQTVTESPAQRQLRELNETQSQKLGQLGISQTDRVADILGKPYQARRFESGLGDYGSDVERRTFDLATAGLDDQFSRSEAGLRTQLANRGIGEDSDAFRSELEAFNRGKGNAYSDAMLGARSQAQSDRSQALGEELSRYNMDTTADLADRQNPLNEIIALMSGVQTSPINPGASPQSNIGAPDIQGATYANYAGQMNAYNQKMNAQNSFWSSLAGLGGAALGGLR